MFLLVLLAILFHPIHISFCEVNYSVESHTLQFSQRIFADDLETALKTARDIHLDILKLKRESRDSLLESYLNDKIELKVDNKVMKLNYLGSEIEEGVCWIYFESVSFENEPYRFTLKNIPLFELFEDQSTIIQAINKNGDVINYRLFGEKEEDLIMLN